jgi:hypothetical protein
MTKQEARPMSEAIEIRFVGHLEKLDIGPDDRFVLTCDQRLSMEVIEHIQRQWKAFCDAKLIVLDCGLKLGAINVTVAEALKEEAR